MNPSQRRLAVWSVALLAAGLAALLAGGAWFYRSQEQAIRQKVDDDLRAVAVLKVQQIDAWRRDQLHDGASFQRHPFLSQSILGFMAGPGAPGEHDLRIRLQSLAEQHDYFDVVVVAPDGTPILSLRESPDLARDCRAVLAEVFRSRKPVFTDLQASGQGLSPQVSVVAPICGVGERGIEACAALVLVHDASSFLYPLLQTWPVPSATAETILVRREGDHVLYLNDLHHQPDTAFRLAIPLTRTDVPAVMAAQGKVGVFQGKDYRGVEVVSALLPVPDSPWFLIAKVDAAEAFADWQVRSGLMLVLLLASTAAVGAAGLVLLQRDRNAHYRALYRSDARYRQTLDSMLEGCQIIGFDWVYRYVNDAAEGHNRRPKEQLLGKRYMDMWPGIEETDVFRSIRRCLEERIPAGLENPFVFPDGSLGYFDLRIEPVPEGVFILSVDVTKRRLAEQQLQRSMERQRFLADIIENAQQPLAVGFPGGRIGVFNTAFCDLTGYDRSELEQINSFDALTPPEWRAVETEALAQASREDRPVRYEKAYRRKDGSVVPVELLVHVVRDETGAIRHFYAFVTDITRRKHAEERIQLVETRGYATAWIGLHDPERGSTLQAEAGVGGGTAEVRRWIEQGHLPECWRRALEQNDVVVMHDTATACGQCPLREASGDNTALAGALRHADREYGVLVAALPAHMADDVDERSLFAELVGDVGYALYGIDTREEREGAIAALRDSEARYRALFESSADGILIAEIDTRRFRYANPAVCRFLGYSERELRAMTLADLHPEASLPNVLAHFETQVRGTATLAQDIPCLRKDGTVVFADVNAAPITIDGRPCMVGFFRDVTDRKLAARENERLQAQLMQAQKMESVGRLAGGVAHDYNNMIGVVLGYSELAMARLGPDDPLREDLSAIHGAALRSRDMTRQLLAFARQQVIAPQILDLNATVEGMLKILRKLIGEDIDLVWHPGRGLWPVSMDPSQLDQILANLCVNARDAIADVGTITIETSTVNVTPDYCSERLEVTPGDFVLLTVSDDGCGMERTTLEHIFEPFFTTKDVGKGTGLGLPTVYGVVRQNGGFVTVYSEPGQGTTFRIHLPRHAGVVADEPKPAVEDAAPGRNETVLVVEDEAVILGMVERILTRYGYVVLPAGTPGEALALAKAHAGDIALLITDVVMPEMNGRELAARMKALFPGIRCLYMSGYTADVIAHRGVLDQGCLFIQKPFSTTGLAAKVRSALDATDWAS